MSDGYTRGPVETFKKAEKQAREALHQAMKAKKEAIAAVDLTHNPIIVAAREDLRSAMAATQDAISAETPDHEWEGQIVEGPAATWGFQSKEIVRGVVFTYRPGVDLGPGHKYARPEIGERYVRLLKKDGKPGVKSIKMSAGFRLATAQSGEA